MQRSAVRELAFKLIYGIEVQKDLDEDYLNLFFENNDITDKEVQNYLRKIKEGIEEHKSDIDELIISNIKTNWSLDRISKINLSLIKIAIFEMLYLDLPYKVAINEVIELSKRYSDEGAPMFINGILASIVKEKGLEEGINSEN